MKASHWMGSITTPSPGPGSLVRLFDTLLDWIERGQQRRVLGQLDGRLLADIGVNRATAKAEADKPWWRE